MSALREITNQVADRKVELKSQWKGKHVVFDEEGHSREVVKQVEEVRVEVTACFFFNTCRKTRLMNH